MEVYAGMALQPLPRRFVFVDVEIVEDQVQLCASTVVLTSSKTWPEGVDPASLSFLSQHMHRIGSRGTSCGQDRRCGGDYQH